MTTYKAKGLNAITIRDDGKAVRLEFDTTEGGVAVAMPASAITALLPILVNAEAEAKEKAGLPKHASVFSVAAGTVGLPAAQDGIVIILTLSEGVELGFQLDANAARHLRDAISARL